MAKPEETSSQKNNLVIILLIGAAFAIGFLWNKVQTLEKGGSAPTQQAANVTPAEQPPARPTELKIKKPDPQTAHWEGSKEARFVLVEYSDLECPFCQRNYPTPGKLVKDFSGKVAHEFRHFPLSFHANAQKEGEAAECAAELGGNEAFWKYIGKIFERTTANGTGFALDKLGPLAKELGMNQQKFQKCLDDGKYSKKVQDQMSEGSSAGVGATPTTVIYDMKTGKTSVIEGAVPYEQQKTQLETFMKEQG